jgi:iron complex outermembrane receptor protein
MKFFIVAALVLLSTLASAAGKTPVAKVNFNLPSQPLVPALKAFAEQADMQLFYRHEIVRGATSTAVVGMYDRKSALALLLTGTGLEFVFTSDDAATIRRARPAAHTPTASNDVSTGDIERPTQSDVVNAGRSSDKPVLDEVIVTGTNIAGNENVAAPMTTITREQIAHSGLMTTQEVLATIPQNFTDITPATYLATETGSILQESNLEGVTAVDLRGLGAESTLTLVNGARQVGSLEGRVIDVSAIPLFAIDRIDVVTGGESAIYGSDAVAGVVNIVTRRSYRGAEIQASYGAATNHGGGERQQFSAITGFERESAGGMIAYDYSGQDTLDLAKTDFLVEHTSFGGFYKKIEVLPQATRHSLLASAHFAPGESIDLYSDISFASSHARRRYDEILERLTTNPSISQDRSSTELLNVDVGAKARLASWTFDTRAYTGFAHNYQTTIGFLDAGDYGYFPLDYEYRNRNSLNSIALSANGKLPEVLGLAPSLALNADYRRETYRQVDPVADAVLTDLSRTVASASAELLVPFVAAGRRPFAHLLQMTLASRFDRYSDVGSTSTPTVGLVWKPFDELTLRGDYARAFRAPALADLLRTNTALLVNKFDPTANAQVPVLEWEGANADIGPEKARTWSAAIDYAPPLLAGTKFTVAYFNVNYTGRINIPATGLGDLQHVLERASSYTGLIDRSPSAQYIQRILATNQGGLAALAFNNSTGIPWNPATQSLTDVFPNLIVFDNRLHNLSVEAFQSIDLGAETHHELAGGEISAQLQGTYTLQHEQRITPTSPALQLKNQVGMPVAFRARGSVGYQRHAYAGFLFINYVDSYKDTYSKPPGTMSSWTTLDTSFTVDGSQFDRARALRGFKLTLAVQNLLNTEPPRFRNGSQNGLGYDAVNGNPMGRFVNVRINKEF